MTAFNQVGLSTNLDQLDKKRSLTRFYWRIDAEAKQRAKTAFLAYEAAVREGDHEHAEAAKARFLAATDVLAKARRAYR